MRPNKKIASLILRAQVASDGGKNIGWSSSRRAVRDNAGGYDRKDGFILETIDLILRTKNDFKFSVVPDKEGRAFYLVYFTTRIDGMNYQVSFHSFSGDLIKYISRKSFRISWDHDNSRNSAVEIYRHYVPEGGYV